MKTWKKDKSILTKRTGAEKVFFGATFVFFALYAASLTLPFVWLFLKSLEEPGGYLLNRSLYGAFWITDTFHFKNYITALTEMQDKGVNFLGMIVNSIWYVGIGTVQTIFWHAITAYVISKYTFRGKKFLYNLVIICAIVPLMGTSAATYKLISALNLYDTGPLYLIITSFGGLGGSFLMMVGMFSGISWSYAEAVFIDGGSDNTVFFKIMLPQVMPALAALAINTAIGLWNNYMQPLMYMPSTPMVASGLYRVSLYIHRLGEPIYFSGLILSMLPVLILYAFIAENMMTNLSIGGLKG